PSIHDKASVVISLVVPAYNEELRLHVMMDETLVFMKDYCSRQKLTFEILIVNDGSTDHTQREIEKYLSVKSNCVRCLKLGINRGKGEAIRRGVQKSRGKYILMVDADGATDINDFGKLFDSIRGAERTVDALGSENQGFTVGSRAHMEADSVAARSFIRTVLMYGFHMLVVILVSRKIKDTQCGFKLFTRSTAKILFTLMHLDRWSFDIELVFLAEALRIPMTEVAVNWHEVDGSKLIQSKFDIVVTSLTMARDMLCVRLCHAFKIWSYKEAYRICKKDA
ncbi:unnamed protein product, partial [Ectocarpus fasciculatus]